MQSTTHIANPVKVNAAQILEVTEQASGNLALRLSDGRNYEADRSMTVRHCPVVGDYLVTQEDGYEYLNPKDVFERKYAPAGAPQPTRSLIVITVQDTENGAVVSLAAEPAMNMAAPPASEAQKLAHLMLGALPMNGPRDEAHTDVELLKAMEGVLDKAAALTRDTAAKELADSVLSWWEEAKHWTTGDRADINLFSDEPDFVKRARTLRAAEMGAPTPAPAATDAEVEFPM